MLDSKARRFVEPLFRRNAEFLLGRGCTPNGITASAFVVGTVSSAFILAGMEIPAVLALWASGWLDAVDGTAARISGKTDAWGTVLDITSDRLVEVFIILSLASKHPGNAYDFLLLLSAVLMSMTVFLTAGALVENHGKKSFHYQGGMAERTEGFIFFTLMILFQSCMGIIIRVFATLIAITFLQRLVGMRNNFKKKG